jgi:hypothetical protein
MEKSTEPSFSNIPVEQFAGSHGALNPHPLFLREPAEKCTCKFFSKKRDGKNGLEFRIEGTVDHPEFSLN